MATVFILVCSVFGFAGGLVAYFAFDTSIITALCVWLGAGPVAVLICAGLVPFLHRLAAGFSPIADRNVGVQR